MAGRDARDVLATEQEVRALAESFALFNQRVVDALVTGRDSTLKLVVRCDRGVLLQCLIEGPEILRPRKG